MLSSANPAVRAVQFWAALQGALQVGKLSRINPELFDGAKLGMDTALTMLRGWGADPDALQAALTRVDSKT